MVVDDVSAQSRGRASALVSCPETVFHVVPFKEVLTVPGYRQQWRHRT